MLNRENRDWMERMSNTSYQRGTQDMLDAGLNPMLAYSQGGASTPNNSAATVRPVDAGAKAIGDAAQRAVAVAANSAQVQKTEAETRLTEAKAIQEEAKVPWAEQMANWAFNNAQQKFYSEMAKMHLSDEQKRLLQERIPLVEEELRARIRLMNEQASSSKAVGDINRARLQGEKVQEEMYETLGPAKTLSEQAIRLIIMRILGGK